MTLHQFYKLIESEHDKAQEKVNEYIKLAKAVGIPEEEYSKDSVYKALAETANKYRFTKNLVMDNLKDTGGSSFFKRK